MKMSSVAPALITPYMFPPRDLGSPPQYGTSAAPAVTASRGVVLRLVGALLPVTLQAPQHYAALVLLLHHELRVADRTRLRNRLVPRDEVALLLRPVRAAVERLAAPRPLLGDEPAAALPRAPDAERDRLSGLALGVLGARQERAEAAALDRHRRAAGLAHLVGGLRRDLLPGAVEVLHDLLRVAALR